MKLYQVRKGQFVYYNNELHKVYGVKPMFKQSVHLIRMRDLTQHLTKAVNVERYKIQPQDSFIFNHKVYTLSKDKKAEEGDYILITNPSPDYLDNYTLNSIEVVETVENKGVITNRSNGIKHSEYLLMVPGRDENSHPIDYKEISEGDINDDALQLEENGVNSGFLPTIGDVYKKVDPTSSFEAMVIAIQDQKVFLGGGLEISQKDLLDTEKWEFLYNLLDK
ncbi:hypothetical protein JOD43_002289 [Pullulanibacillus pueri]|uniref:Uncharacterized protein n=1 Tax=Pullulanibacillus pueri TaxID=1437324 RepID=A0A8J2ZVK0_9BACL|nr:hypothetical protein [Pullulanibacillus pueri]MBM7682116.1 hypothetical protein [Pullulanibacillus pueri]GGH79917.1 hypothetical protein GCM10007096_15550 [Pullulanibacillus pueri]